MRKTIFILAALFAATFANAQITLEHTFSNSKNHSYNMPYGVDKVIYVLGDIFTIWRNENVYAMDLHTYTETLLPKVASDGLWLVAKGYLTADSRICFIVSRDTNNAHHLFIYDENGTMIQDLGVCNDEQVLPFLLRNGEYKLRLDKIVGEERITEIYSLPGNGEAQAVSTPSSPKRAARKIARDGQVLVETDNNIYTLQGQELK